MPLERPAEFFPPGRDPQSELSGAKGKKFEHHVWQPGRGHDRNIIPTKTLLRMIDDVHENPVRRGLVTQARDWEWSSAGWFEGQPLSDLEPDPITWDWLEGAS